MTNLVTTDFVPLENPADKRLFVAGVGVFDIKDPALHALYPNFTTVKAMIKEIDEARERLALIEALSDFTLDQLREMTKLDEERERRALISQLSDFSLSQLTEAMKSLK